MTRLFSNGSPPNGARTTFASGIASGTLSCTVASGDGALFPNPSSPDDFCVTFISASNAAVQEIVLVTARSGDTFTIVRAQEGTTALNWSSGDLIVELVTNGDYALFLQGISRGAQLLTGASNFKVPSGIYWISGTAVGGGGGGGASTTTSAGQTSAAPGGNAAPGVVFGLSVTPGQTIAFSCGAGGAGGMAGGGNGQVGGTTTFGTVTAPGGYGGAGTGANTPPYVQIPTAATVKGSGAGVIVPGFEVVGGPSFSGASLNAISGKGGDGPWGGGGSPADSAAGVAGQAPGAGGSGSSIDQSSTGLAGGAGADGAILVTY